MEATTKAQIFARHVGCQCGYNDKAPVLTVWLTDHEHICIKTAICIDYPLLLTPLSAITDEDAIQIGEWCGITVDEDMHPNKLCTARQPLSDLKKSINMMKSIDAFNARIYQYLQCRGYALPQTVIEGGKPVTYSVEQLVNEGIFKLIEK
jgi:hypothetical protein